MARKKQKQRKPEKKISSLYGNGKAKNPSCPKCGAGTFMAVHKNRVSCGKCGYSEFKDKDKK